ncbi:hypothetical protein FWD07_02520 [Candidatus Saccharibacteria bacterium]|nr:hypothetical protein [Candidatus Saccharibacteria bacterium]
MSDIDFDELDKAVGSMMEGEEERGGDGDDAESVQGEEVKEKNGSDEQEVTEAKPVARRRGRFMDMVHPSSDMHRSPSMGQERTVDKEVTEVADETERTEESSVGEDEQDVVDAVLEDLDISKDAGMKEEDLELSSVEMLDDGVYEEENKDYVEKVIDEVVEENSEGGEGDDEEMEIAENEEGAEESEPEEEVEEGGGDEEVEEVEETVVEEGDSEEEPDFGEKVEIDDIVEEVEEKEEEAKTPFIRGAKIEKRPLGEIAPTKDGMDEMKSTEGNFSAASVVDELDNGRSIYETDEIETTVVREKKTGGGWVWLLVFLAVIALGVGLGVGVWYFVM